MPTTLQNFPIVSQLTSVTSDSRASENAGYDCVPGSIGACILWYQHKSQWDSSINPDLLKDLAYGEAYRNDGTAAITYVPICQKLGYKLYSIDGNNAQLVQKAHELIQANIPVIFTEPDPYSSNPGDSHVCVFYSEGNGALTALDPYIAKSITRTDGVWQSMLLFGQIWALEEITVSTLDLLKQHGWHDDGTTLIAPNGVPVVRGFRDFVLAHNWNPDNYPLAPEYGTPQLEGSNQALGGGTQQVFRWTMLGWTQAHGVFEEWTGQELLYLSKKVADYYKQVQDLQKQLQGGQPVPPSDPLASQALAVVRQIKPLFQPF